MGVEEEKWGADPVVSTRRQSGSNPRDVVSQIRFERGEEQRTYMVSLVARRTKAATPLTWEMSLDFMFAVLAQGREVDNRRDGGRNVQWAEDPAFNIKNTRSHDLTLSTGINDINTSLHSNTITTSDLSKPLIQTIL